MHLHYKNMKHLCAMSDAWVQKHLRHLGIDKFGCNFIDLKHNTYLPLVNHYDVYCEFIEKKHHLNMALRVQQGVRYWPKADPLHQMEQQFRAPHVSVHMLDWTLKTEHGFELFYVITQQRLRPHHLCELKQWMDVFSRQAAQVKKCKPRAQIELDNRDVFLEKYRQFDGLHPSTTSPCQPLQFDDLVLTAQEQVYIQHLMGQRTYQDIALRDQVTEAAVCEVIDNIKCKLGCPMMPIAEMFTQLDACGALAACMEPKDVL